LFLSLMILMRTKLWSFTPGFIKIPYNDIEALEEVLKRSENIAAFLVDYSG
jgi:ornithine--oxo-acid transaminase